MSPSFSFLIYKNKGAAQGDLADPFRLKNTGLPFPTVLPETIRTGQVQVPVWGPFASVCRAEKWVTQSVQAHTHSCIGPSLVASSRTRASCWSQQRPSLWGPCPVTEELLSGEATSCRAGQMDMALPKQRKYTPWHPASSALRANPGKKPACSLLTGIVVAARQPVPQSAHSPRILPGVFTGSHGEEAGQVPTEAALRSVRPPQGDFGGSAPWELLGTLQNRNGFRAPTEISCLTFAPAACASQNVRRTYSGKLLLTCEITFRAVINMPGGRVTCG